MCAVHKALPLVSTSKPYYLFLSHVSSPVVSVSLPPPLSGLTSVQAEQAYRGMEYGIIGWDSKNYYHKKQKKRKDMGHSCRETKEP